MSAAGHIAERWTEALRVRGFDLVQRFDAASYNRSPLALGTTFRLPTFGRSNPLALVIAHTATLWNVLVDAVEASEELRSSLHPLDEYTERVVGELERTTDIPCATFFSHRADPVIPIQRIADVAGLAGLSPSQLSVHARVGPWLGLRAVVVFSEERGSSTEPALNSTRPCDQCSAPCMSAFRRAASDPDAPWHAWLAVRDSCPVGRGARYGDRQIRYHYSKQRSLLAADPPPTHRKVGEWP